MMKVLIDTVVDIKQISEDFKKNVLCEIEKLNVQLET